MTVLTGAESAADCAHRGGSEGHSGMVARVEIVLLRMTVRTTPACRYYSGQGVRRELESYPHLRLRLGSVPQP